MEATEFIIRNVSRFLEQILFERNDEVTRKKITDMVNKLFVEMREHHPNEGLLWNVVCDETNNDELILSENALKLFVAYRTKSMKIETESFKKLDFAVDRSGQVGVFEL